MTLTPDKADRADHADDLVGALGERPEDTLSFVRRLRDHLAEGVVPAWSHELPASLNWEMVCHLPPPSGTGDDADRWRRRFRIGLCYYRQGPGFIQVKDLREEPVTLLLDDPSVVDVFVRCLEPTSLRLLSADEAAAAEALLNERLLLRLGDFVVTLPYRMKRWPIPAYAV
ncbi:DUF5825 family protein [Nonomuraea glycinis]|uniref:DUF5825 family protein n=1 Tax=Nonomuraea glycinis TaxID=2047744 RepID=UPI002E122953|nr:DUF5825 family protein [Nonomuraea glycinis]